MHGNFKAKEALALLTTTKLENMNAGRLRDCAAFVADQLHTLHAEQKMIPRRAVAIGLTLHLVKSSLKHGEFTPWLTETLTKLTFVTAGTAKVNASYYMRAAIAFVEQAKPTKTEMAAIAHGELMEGAQLDTEGGPVGSLMKRIDKFVGERSLNELLVDEGIKTTQGSLGGGSGGHAALPADNDTLAEDAGQLLMRFDDVLLNPDHIKRFSAQQLEDMEQQLAARLEKFRALKAQLLNPTH